MNEKCTKSAIFLLIWCIFALAEMERFELSNRC